MEHTISEFELKESLSRVLEEHQHESGLHMIGGRQRLIDRLVAFFEEIQDKAATPWSQRRSC
jgi:hypothetical protein